MPAAGGSVRVIRELGEEAVREVLPDAIEQFRVDDRGFRLESAWHLPLATS